MLLPLSNKQEGEEAHIDDADWDLVKDMKWRVLRQKRSSWISKYVVHHYYERGKNGKLVDATAPKYIYLHRFIMKPSENLVVDHINGNGLDNRRVNLRVVTQRENMKNRIHYSKPK